MHRRVWCRGGEQAYLALQVRWKAVFVPFLLSDWRNSDVCANCVLLQHLLLTFLCGQRLGP